METMPSLKGALSIFYYNFIQMNDTFGNKSLKLFTPTKDVDLRYISL